MRILYILFIFTNIVLAGMYVGHSPSAAIGEEITNIWLSYKTNLVYKYVHDVIGNNVGHFLEIQIHNTKHHYYGATMSNVLVVVNTNDIDSIKLLSVVSNYWIDTIGFNVLQLSIPNSVRAMNGQLVMGDNDNLKPRYGEVFFIGDSSSRIHTQTTAWEFLLSPITNYLANNSGIRYIACLKGVPYTYYTGKTVQYDTKMRAIVKEWQSFIGGHNNVNDIRYRNKIASQRKLFGRDAPLLFYVDGVSFEDASNLVARSSNVDHVSLPYTNWWNITDGIFNMNWFSFYAQYTNAYGLNVCYSANNDTWRATNSPMIAYSSCGRYNNNYKKVNYYEQVTNGVFNIATVNGAIASVVESYTCESYDGYWFNQYLWLMKTANGGTNYERTMCGFFGPVSEPYLGGQGNESVIYPRYFQGFSFVEAAWMGIQNHTHIVCGYPFMRVKF